MASNISQDLIWEVTRGYNAMMVKRKQAGGVQFSRDPLNLRNVHSRKQAGFVNDKAIGIQPGEKGGVKFMTKKAGKANKPASSLQTTTLGSSTSTRKTYRSIVNSTAKHNYRPDLRADAVARASAIRKTQKPVKPDPPSKPRGARARKATESESS
ncbi:60S ribosomal protein-like protein L28 [Lineolata rhizophorae]|uniref:60S ribosomal protein-like protein L28 n=1 Tax=Lineolata rhizophorae TaxID=578093 RepID=A0A6A6P071_9PEZI|nr:60S ribosomal protein-like protein L28 [Lineolata rhizophorae]